MNPNAAKKGRSFKGVAAYIVHDPDRAKTAERVLFTDTRNLRTDDPEKAAKVMAYTAAHAAHLKQAAGIKAGGRKSENPVYHFSLSWVPGEQPTKADMLQAGEQALQVLGFGEHEAMFAAHGDKEHMHLHIVVNRIHPQTGKTHNPNDDYARLQQWGHAYDKTRGMEHRSPERAAKHEKDPIKKAEYQELAEAARREKGLANDNRPRPQHEAEKEATHSRSKRYQEIKQSFAARTKNLVIETRTVATRHKEQWQSIKQRHKQERSALWEQQQAAYKARTTFNRASGHRPLPSYSWQQYQKDRTALRSEQQAELRTLAATLKQKNEPQVKKFFDKQREARATEKRRLVALEKNLRVTTKTPVGSQGREHQGHLTGAFNQEVTKDWRTRQFLATQKQEKAEFFASLDEKNRPALEELKAHHNDQSQVLRGKLDTARELAKQEQTRKAESSKQVDRNERAQLTQRHRAECDGLKEQHGAERVELQGQWANLNDDRAKAWDAYRVHRTEQEQGTAQTTTDAKVHDSFARAADPGRAAAQSRRSDPGRDGSTQAPSGGRSRDFNRN